VFKTGIADALANASIFVNLGKPQNLAVKPKFQS